MAEHQHNGDHRGGPHTTETPDASYIKNVDVTHEVSDVNVNGIVKFVIALTVLTIAVLGLMLLLFKVLDTQTARKDEQTQPGPMAMTEQERLPPEPRLQQARGFGVKLENGEFVALDSNKAPAQPQAEYRIIHEQWQRMLTTGKSNDSDSMAALPIDQAMKQVLQANSLPVRQESGKAKTIEDVSVSLPTAASSGRKTVKRLE
jgi:hypothetical protein